MINLRQLAADVVDNPVAVREFRMRMRGGRAYLVIFGYVLALSLVLFMTYFGVYSFSIATGNIPQDFGETLFRTLVGVQIALIGLVVPGLTAWLISIEKEQQTFELLVSTLLTPLQIVVGKLLPAISFLGLLLGTSLPLATFCLVFGGLSPTRVVAGYLGLLMFGIVLACIGIICSTLFKKSFAATVAAYVASGAVFLGPFFVMGIAASSGFGLLGGSDMWAGAAMLAGFFVGVMPDETLTARLLNLEVPTIAINVVINSVFALLLTSMATANMPHYKVDRGPAIRLLLFIYTVLLLVSMVGGSYGSGGLMTDVTPTHLSVVFGMITFLAALAAPQLTASPLNKGENKIPHSILKKLNPRTWLQTDGGSGLWFSLGWALLLGAISIGIMVGFAKAFPGMALNAGILFVLLGATTFMYGCMGIMLYAMTLQTASARALAFVVTAIHWAITTIMVSMMREDWFGIPATAKDSGITFVHYIWPLAPFYELADPSSMYGQLFGFYFFIVNLVLGLVMLQVASVFFKKAEQKRLQSIPAPVFKEPAAG